MARINSVEILVTILAATWLLSGCSGYRQLVEQGGLSDQLTPGTLYQHRVLINPAGQQDPDSELWHVYIEGDGRAVTARGTPSLDPTPRTPLLLPMLAQDPAPALYLGRPCYFHTDDPNCSPLNWTLARYSPDTVASMAAALRQHIPASARVLLIGHSGGGTLAVLMAALLAEEQNNASAVVTLAGNLQVATWTRYHRYSPLTQSLDPMTQPPLPACISQYHFAGAEDGEILPVWIEEFAQRQPSSQFQRLAGVTHREGWPLWWTLINIEPTIKSQRCDKVTR